MSDELAVQYANDPIAWSQCQDIEALGYDNLATFIDDSLTLRQRVAELEAERKWRRCITQGDMWAAPETCEVVGVPHRRDRELFGHRIRYVNQVVDIAGVLDFYWRPWSPPEVA